MTTLALSPLLPASGSGIPTNLSGLETTSQIALLLLLLLLNAFFVASEFALVKLRAAQLDENGKEPSPNLAFARRLAANPDHYLSVCQLGITLCSVLLGALSAPFLSLLLHPLLLETGLGATAIRWISFVLAISVIAFLHFLVGEQLAKAVALQHPLRISTTCARPLHWIHLPLALPVRLLEGCARLVLRHVLRIDPDIGLRPVPTADELRMIVEETGEADEVTATEQEIAINALELSELSVRDIVTPRNEVVAMDVHKTFQENLAIALESKHTRFPLVNEHLDNTLGLIHIKDLIGEINQPGGSPDLFRLKREMHRVPETQPLDELLRFFLGKHAHMALVVDEFGGAVGLVMLDDVLDQIVGDIADEFDDEERVPFRRIDERRFVVDGALPLHELADEVPDLELEKSPDVATVGGYLTGLVGRLPDKGDSAVIEGYRAEVVDADERTVHAIRFTRLEAP